MECVSKRLALGGALLGALLGGACDEPRSGALPASTGDAPKNTATPGPATRAAELPLLNVTLELEAWKKLIAQIRNARERGSLVRGDEPWVPIVLTHGNARFDATARLAGDRLEHLNLQNPALRVRLAGTDRLLGLRRFALLAPESRGHHAELLYFEALRALDVLTPRQQFVHVGFGREHASVMVMEEAFGRDLLDDQRRKPGVILRFDDVVGGAEGTVQGTRPPIVTFERKRVEGSERLRGERDLAIGLLRGFLEGKLSAAQVFDVERLSSFLAVSELWDAAGALHWNNLRFAYDPYTGRLEPVAYDAGVMAAPRGPTRLNLEGGETELDRALRAGWLRDARVRARTLERLHGLALRVLEGTLLRELQAREAAVLAGLPAGLFDAHRIDWKRFRARAVELAPLDDSGVATASEPRAAGLAPAAEPAARTLPVLADVPVAELAKKLRWLKIDEAARRVSVAPGVYVVRTTLTLPLGHVLVLAPGVTLRFARDAALVVQGGCEVQGSKEQPVRMEPSGADWPGLVVLGGGSKCDVQGLMVRGTRGLQTGEWRLSSGTTFYDTELSLRDASFEASTARNALHLVRSRVALERVRVSKARTDGVDADHSTGSARELTCEAVGADCLDTRSSELTLDGKPVPR